MDEISRATDGEPKKKRSRRRSRAKGPEEVEEVTENRLSEEVLADVGEAPAEPEPPQLEDPTELSRVLMAVLLVAREPVSKLRLAQVCAASQEQIAAALEVLQADLSERGFPVEVNTVDDSVRLLTAPEVYPYLERLKGAKKADKLSPAALETLAVVAYRQPVMRVEIESIRGVKVGPTLRTLLEHKLVDVVGRADVPGRPLQYGTTQHFLDRFGLASVKDLPSVKEFRSL